MNSLLPCSNPPGIKSLSVVTWLLLACTAPAAQVKLDLLTVGARTYTNVIVLNYNTTHVYFTHEGGSTSAWLRDLDAELQKRFDYDPAAAAQAEKQQAADEARFEETVASNAVAATRPAAPAAKKFVATSADNLADPISDRSLIGRPAPPIEGGRWLGEKPALEGKLVLVVFWAPWSIPCRKYIPTLDELQKKFAGKLAVVGVTSESEAEIADMTEPKIGFVSMLDPEGKFRAAVGVTSIPYVMLVDPKGVVRYQGHPAAISEKQMEGILARIAD